MRSKGIAGILGIFLGGLGFHKFYLGKPVQGLLYLVFCWTFIPSIIGFFEGVFYFSFTDENWDKAYNLGAESKKCPFCLKIIHKNAIKCSYCQSSLTQVSEDLSTVLATKEEISIKSVEKSQENNINTNVQYEQKLIQIFKKYRWLGILFIFCFFGWYTYGEYEKPIPLRDVTHEIYDFTGAVQNANNHFGKLLESCNYETTKKKKADCIVYVEKTKKGVIESAQAEKMLDDIITNNLDSLVADCKDGIKNQNGLTQIIFENGKIGGNSEDKRITLRGNARYHESTQFTCHWDATDPKNIKLVTVLPRYQQ